MYSWSDDPKWIDVDEAYKLLPEEVVNQALLEADEMVFGISFVDENGRRIDPREVSL